MAQFGQILLATDFSPETRAASHYAVALARVFETEIALLHVCDHSNGACSAECLAGEQLSEFALDVGADGQVPVQTALLNGAFAPGIVSYAAKNNAGCVVLSKRNGRLGSTALYVLRSCRCPVLTVPRNGAHESKGRKFQNIIVPTDFSDSADAVLPYAVAMANSFGARLHLIHVFEDDWEYARLTGDESCESSDLRWLVKTRRERSGMLDTRARSLDGKCAVRAVQILRSRHTADDILAYAQTENADCILVGVRSRASATPFLFGSCAEHLLSAAPCAVFCFK